MRFDITSVSTAFIAVTIPALVGLAAPDSSARATDLPPPIDNAAVDYLYAATLIKQPATEAEFGALKFINREFAWLPPDALADRPDAAAYLQGDKVGNSSKYTHDVAMEVLHCGTLKATCHFDIDWTQGPESLLLYLNPVRDLGRKAVAIGKRAEYTHNPSQAAAIYADVIAMGVHLAEDPVMIHHLSGADMALRGADAAVGLLSRDPPKEAVEALFAGLERFPHEPFGISGGLRNMARECDWYLGHPEQMYTAMNLSVPPGQQTEATAQQQMRECRTILMEMTDAAQGPYYESAPRMKLLVERAREKLTVAESQQDGALPSAVAWRAAEFNGGAARVNANLNMLRMLTAATLCKCETGAYPEALAALTKYFPNGLPRDPFTGRDFLYSIKDDLPCVECQPAVEVREHFGPWGLILELSDRRQRDAFQLKTFRERIAADKER